MKSPDELQPTSQRHMSSSDGGGGQPAGEAAAVTFGAKSHTPCPKHWSVAGHLAPPMSVQLMMDVDCECRRVCDAMRERACDD